MKVSAGKILMIVENPFPQDTRVNNEAAKLAEAGYKVSVIAKKYPDQTMQETLFGINIYRVPWFEVFKKSTESNSKLPSLSTECGIILNPDFYSLLNNIAKVLGMTL